MYTHNFINTLIVISLDYYLFGNLFIYLLKFYLKCCENQCDDAGYKS